MDGDSPIRPNLLRPSTQNGLARGCVSLSETRMREEPLELSGASIGSPNLLRPSHGRPSLPPPVDRSVRTETPAPEPPHATLRRDAARRRKSRQISH